AGLVTVLTYYAALIRAVKTYNPLALFRWVTSYSQEASFSFHAGKNLVTTLVGHVRLFWGGRLPLVRAVWNPFIAFTTVAVLLLAMLLVLRVRRGAVSVVSAGYFSMLWVSCL